MVAIPEVKILENTDLRPPASSASEFLLLWVKRLEMAMLGKYRTGSAAMTELYAWLYLRYAYEVGAMGTVWEGMIDASGRDSPVLEGSCIYTGYGQGEVAEEGDSS